MKVYSNYIIILIISTLLNQGCKKKWLDVKPDIYLAVPASLTDYSSLLDNINDITINSPGLGEIASDGHYITDASFKARTDNERNAYTWSHDVPYLSVSDWISAYGKIYSSNLVLEGLSKIKDLSAADRIEWNSIRGNALFHRARAFYELAQVFAPVYKKEAVEGVMGMPLRTESDITLPSVRSPLTNIYRQIIEDLMEAKNLLPIIPQYKTRGSRPAACSFLSRTYLVMQDYDMAKRFADSALGLYNTLLDYNSISKTAAFPFGLFNQEVIFHSSIVNYGALGSLILIDKSLYDSFADSDLRKILFFTLSGTDIRFKGYYTGSRLCFSGIATDELYLIRAECNARVGELKKAADDLNFLLRTRWKTDSYQDYQPGSQKEVLNRILFERKKQLLLRGLRWSDLRRLNIDPDLAVNFTRIINGTNYSLTADSYKYTFPIPDNVINMSGMKQNIGWD